MTEKTYSTNQVAKLAGIHRATLYRWLETSSVRASIETPIEGDRTVRRWTAADLEKLKRYVAENYVETRPKGKK
jgi:transposase-like protein